MTRSLYAAVHDLSRAIALLQTGPEALTPIAGGEDMGLRPDDWSLAVDLKQAINRLPPRQREAVVLHLIYERPIREITRRMRASEHTVIHWIRSALCVLVRHMETSLPEVDHAQR